MIRNGGCRCGAVRYAVEDNAAHHGVCHCSDCRASSGAPMMAWYAVQEDQFHLLSGSPTRYEGTPGAIREFCPRCGTGLFYRNADVLPGLVDIQSSTFDDTADLPPQAQIQGAERLPWVANLDTLPLFERYPDME